jgi:PAS domain S-box-containing protein
MKNPAPLPASPFDPLRSEACCEPPDGRRVDHLRGIAAQQRARAAEGSGAAELAQRVQERTVDLEQANRRLKSRPGAQQISEQRFRNLVDCLPEAIAIHRGGRLIHVNRSALRLFGAESELNLLGKPILDLISPASRDFVVQRMNNAVEHGTQGTMAGVALVKLDGTPLEAEVLETPIDFEGQTALLASIRDITAQRQAEGALRKITARLAGIFNCAADAIITADETKTLIAVNPAASEMFRCPQDDMVGSPLERFIPERFRANHEPDMNGFGEAAAVHARHMGRARDVLGLRADGEEFPVDVAISHLNLDGRPLYTAILRDITERRRVEQELQAGRAIFEAALTSMSDAVVICDTQGRVIEFNDAFVTFCKFKRRQECPRTLAEYLDVLDILMADGAPATLDQWAVPRALRGKSASTVEFRIRRRDTGQSWIASCSYAPTRAQDGTITGAVVTARDVTEFKQKQAEVDAAHADLLRVIAAKDKVREEERQRIARDLHDDLQQTLTAIRIDLGVLGEMLHADPTAAPAMLAMVEKLAASAITSARRIVNDLQPHVLDDLGFVPALSALASQFRQRTGVSCQLEVHDVPSGVSSGWTPVATSLFRIAQEALNNVLKHAQASAVQIRLEAVPGGHLRLRVTDNGRGMCEADRRKAQSFGLLGMQERVRELGGSLRIAGQLGAGTTIEVMVALPIPARFTGP